jgi:hypothetical protein
MYFKIIRGYNTEDYIEIDRSELEKAYYCFLEKKDAIFSGGAVRGSQIQTIQPDFHRAMGWNRGYKLGAEDFEELGSKGVDRKYRNILLESENRVKHLIETKQEYLIGKGVDIPKIETKVSNEVAQLANSKRIS